METNLPRFLAGHWQGVKDAWEIEETFGGIPPVHVILNTGRPGTWRCKPSAPDRRDVGVFHPSDEARRPEHPAR